MPDPIAQILDELAQRTYQPLKPKQLAKKLSVSDADYAQFRRAIKGLIAEGRIELGKNNVLRPADQFGSLVGIYRRTNSGHGYVRPSPTAREDTDPDIEPIADIYIREGSERDAATGDEVLVKITRRASVMKDAAGQIVKILARATRTFVGTYFERDGEGFVRVDGTVFAHSISVGDPGAKGAKPQDKVVVELLKFPNAEERGEGVIAEVLGPLNEPGVDLLTIIRGLGLPEAFSEEALAEARSQADQFREDMTGRTDFTGDCVITIDPADARDFDDAVSLEIDEKTKHWILTVHIADVAHFAPLGGALDTEARKRATSIYLPRKVIPMFPEIISNGLASLQEQKFRYVKTVQIEFTPTLQKADVRFFNGVIKTRKRFSYEDVQAIFNTYSKPDDAVTSPVDPQILAMLKLMASLASRLRKKRFKRGSLELSMPETVLDYDTDGRVTGAHFAVNDDSHRMIEEFMLAANEAVAEHFSRLGVPFLRRVHPAPKEEKLEAFARFCTILGYPIKRHQDRFELQRILTETVDKPERAAIHFAMLRSLKQATYSPIQDEHYALASQDYCHFTSPIRRYPDLVVHRLLDRWIRTRTASADLAELKYLGDQCSRLERRAELAERELTKLKILQYLSTRIGESFDAVITGVAEFGFFALGQTIPAEGLVHVSSLPDDYYTFEEDSQALYGRRTQARYRLGDRITVQVARVDLQRRMLDFRLEASQKPPRRISKH